MKMIHIVWFLFFIFIIFFIGSIVLRIISNRSLDIGKMERITVSFGLGILTVSLIQLYATFIRAPLNRMNILLLISPFFIIQSYYLSKTDIDIFSRIIKSIRMFKIRDFFLKVRTISLKINILELLSIIYLVLLCFIILFTCLATPMYTWDSRATWGFKAKVLFNKQTIFTDDFFDPYRFHPNTPYPILIPLAENFFYNMLGYLDDYLVKVIFALFYITLVIFIYIAQRKYFLIPKQQSLVFSCIFASIPSLFVIYSGSVPSAYSDFPLAFFYTLNIIYLLSYMKNRNVRTIIIASLFSCSCIFTKNEGLPLFIISIIILITDGIRNKYLLRKGNIQALLVYIFLPILLLAPWFIIKSKLPRINYNNPLPFLNITNFFNGLFQLKLIIMLAIREMCKNYNSWGIIWIIIAITMGLKYGQDEKIYNPRVERYLLIIPLAYYFLVITPIYMMYCPIYGPGTIELEFSGTSFERLCLHTFPLLLLFVFWKINQFLHSTQGLKNYS